MRGFCKASALLLAPTAVLARPAYVSPVDSTLVAVDVGTLTSAAKTLVFRIDIHESSQACDPAKVRIDGYLLSQDDTGAGQGTFAALDGPIVTASWNFTCMEQHGVSWDQEMAMTIMSLDGEAVPATSFSASFSQTAPAMVYEVGGDSRLYTSEDENDTLLDELLSSQGLVGFDDELKAEIREMKVLSNRIHELEDLLEAKELQVLKRLGLDLPTSVFDCRDLRCVFQTVSHNAQLVRSNLCKATDSRWKAVFGCPTEKQDGVTDDDGIEDTHDNIEEVHGINPDDNEDHDEQSSDGRNNYYENDNGNSWNPHNHHRHHGARLPLLLIVAESAITFGFLFACILHFIRRRVERRRQGGCSSSNSRGKRCCRGETCAERRVRRQARRENTRSFFRGVVNGLFRNEDLVKKNEKQIMASTPQTATTTNTMEHEIAGFREAAAMISDMVTAAEEGRMSEQSPPPRHASYAEDESLPPYDSEAEDAYGPMVTDGTRYTPGEDFKR